MWRAARASGAAPSFFRPEGNYIDGGIIANNPSLDLLTEIAEYNIASRATGHLDDIVEPTVLLSLGESFFICLFRESSLVYSTLQQYLGGLHVFKFTSVGSWIM